MIDPKRLRTSDVVRTAASWLTIFAHSGELPRSTVAELDALVAELRVRGRWLESARSDLGVSADRMAGIATIEDPQ